MSEKAQPADPRTIHGVYHRAASAAARTPASAPTDLHRAVCDYIAGMTDRFAIREHRRIFDIEELA
jgi:dGTPase